jgi:hypothetical protein
VNLEGFGLPRTEALQAPARLEKWLDELRAPADFADYADVPNSPVRIHAAKPPVTPERAAGWRSAGAARCRAAACACSPILRIVA